MEVKHPELLVRWCGLAVKLSATAELGVCRYKAMDDREKALVMNKSIVL